AYIMRDVCGEWAYWFVICAVIISLLGGWVAWTLVVSQVPYEASLLGILPECFSRLNRHNMPAFGLMASSIAMEVFLLMVVMADDVYLAALNITGLMIIPCYFFTGLFLLKEGCGWRIRVVALIATLFCLWMAYAGGLLNMVMTSAFYLSGIVFYVKVRKERDKPGAPLFTKNEKFGLASLAIGTIFTIFYFFN
ncbi:MAG: arginine:ornithine antiporter, partial [Muribaculaceae bacterium]|nr:arginine:ornithine antiporter [Muribaculaceae bacterium]